MTAELTQPKLTFWDIEQAWVDLMAAREEAEQVPDPEERTQTLAAVDQALAEYTAREVQKVDGIRAVCRGLKSLIDASREERNYQDRRLRSAEAMLDRVKLNVKAVMEASGKKNIEGRTGRLMLRGNGGVAPLVVNESLLPDEYRKITITTSLSAWSLVSDFLVDCAAFTEVGREIDNAAIRKALSDGNGVPGAHLGERGNHVEVK